MFIIHGNCHIAFLAMTTQVDCTRNIPTSVSTHLYAFC